MGTITIIFESTEAKFCEIFDSQFVRFSTQHQLHSRTLEKALNVDPICRGLVQFHYDDVSGKGHFLLTGTSLAPVGRRTMRYPQPMVVTQRTVYRWQNQVHDETHTHIASGIHGFESLCCSEMLAEMVEAAEAPAGGKVTCPLCKAIWQDCQAFEPCDFSNS
ncbi:hypothetical protein AA215_23900 [Salmonella enterica subsp. enterica serovar Newport]|nr:hypothetical protein [Salmonella enterica subsp. enterica serovar Newport]EDW4369030.1 hypothetical protein [Salmonella enterica subsp. diarizonae]